MPLSSTPANVPSGNGRCSASPVTNSAPLPVALPRTSNRWLKSTPTTFIPRWASPAAKMPEPQPRSSTRSPGRSPAKPMNRSTMSAVVSGAKTLYSSASACESKNAISRALSWTVTVRERFIMLLGASTREGVYAWPAGTTLGVGRGIR